MSYEDLGHYGGLHVGVEVGDEGGVDGRRAHALQARRRPAEPCRTLSESFYFPTSKSLTLSESFILSEKVYLHAG